MVHTKLVGIWDTNMYLGQYVHMYIEEYLFCW